MNRYLIVSALVSVWAVVSEGQCCGRQIRIASGRGCCCRKVWGPVASAEDAPWKNVPYDIQLLSDESLVKQRSLSEERVCKSLAGVARRTVVRV